MERSLPQLLHATANVLNVAVSDVLDRFEVLFAERDVLEEQRREAASTKTISAETLLKMGEEVAGVNLVVADVAGGCRSVLGMSKRRWSMSAACDAPI